MKRVWTWVRRIGIGLYALIAGALGGAGAGRVIVDRREMYGDDPRNDPYSPEFDPTHKPTRNR
jgi:hypothetical protein